MCSSLGFVFRIESISWALERDLVVSVLSFLDDWFPRWVGCLALWEVVDALDVGAGVDFVAVSGDLMNMTGHPKGKRNFCSRLGAVHVISSVRVPFFPRYPVIVWRFLFCTVPFCTVP